MTSTQAGRRGLWRWRVATSATWAALVMSGSLIVACGPKTPALAPVTTTLPPVFAEPTWEEQLSWILRLEDRRLLRDPSPPAPVVLRPATPTEPALMSAPAPADLLALLEHKEPRVRRRAALAVGRAGLPAGAAPLERLLSDADPEVRQMAIFALGLLASPTSRPAVLGALADPDPVVHGRAAEALGRIGDMADAEPIGQMIRAHIAAGALSGVAADDVSYPLASPVEAVRLGLYALVRLRAYDALAVAVLDPGGRPVSAWWPVAYALQRVGDPRAAPALTALLESNGRYAASFAVRGLAAAKAVAAAPSLRRLVDLPGVDVAVAVQAIRALALLGDVDSARLLTGLVTRGSVDPAVRAEAASAMVPLMSAASVDLLVDLTSDRSPVVRAGAFRALARVDPDTLVVTLSGLDVDGDWRVREAVATALGGIGAARGGPLLTSLVEDRDPRVALAAMNALVAAKAPNAEAVLRAQLASPDIAVRATAANLLGEMRATTALAAVTDAFRRAAAEETYVVRAATLGAWFKIDRASALPVVRERLKDPDWAVRVRAAQLLAEAGEMVDPDSIRPAPSRQERTDVEWLALAAPPFSPHAFIETDKGTIEIELAVLDAPLTVANFVTLARKRFFDGVTFHRVIPDFVVQGGDPRGDGEGGPGHTIRDEINQRPYVRGTVGMALDWKDTGGSQFFITHSPQPHLDGGYTVFGHVVAGMDVVDRIVAGDVMRRVRIWDGVTAAQ